MPEELKTYFNSIANTLASKAETAGVFSGRGDIGKCREIVTQEFFKKHAPPRFTVNLGGEIFGLPNQCSGQIDVIINHDMTASFKENTLYRCPIESVIAAVTVKSNLNKQQLYDALENLSSIPQPDKEVLTTGVLSKPFNEYALSWPSLFVFAFDGVAIDTCVKHMKEFYEKNPVPFNRIPRAIIVNKKYIISFIHYNVPNANLQTLFSPDFLNIGILTPDNQGCALF